MTGSRDLQRDPEELRKEYEDLSELLFETPLLHAHSIEPPSLRELEDGSIVVTYRKPLHVIGWVGLGLALLTVAGYGAYLNSPISLAVTFSMMAIVPLAIGLYFLQWKEIMHLDFRGKSVQWRSSRMFSSRTRATELDQCAMSLSTVMYAPGRAKPRSIVACFLVLNELNTAFCLRIADDADQLATRMERLPRALDQLKSGDRVTVSARIVGF